MPKDASRPVDESAVFEQLVAQQQGAHYLLRLFVTGMTHYSTTAIAAIRGLCEQRLAGRFTLEVVDLYKNPSLAKQEQVIAAPTLVKQLPPPERRLIGDLSDQQRVAVGLGLRRE